MIRNNEAYNKVQEILLDEFKVKKEIKYNMLVSELDLDSLDFINFVFKIEEINNTKIPNDFLDNSSNLKLSDLLEYN